MAVSPAARRAVVAGASGLVGRALLDRLLGRPDWAHVTVLGRRPSGRQHPKLEERVLDFDHLDAHADAFAAEDVFCCLGTTLRAAGSREAFYRVDHDYPVAMAGLARAAGAGRFLMVSSLGANPKSANFYLRTKGEAERDVAARGPAMHWFARPSMLTGARAETRPGELAGVWLGRLLSPVFVGPLARYALIAATDVAESLVALALQDGRGGAVESDRLRALAHSMREDVRA